MGACESAPKDFFKSPHEAERADILQRACLSLNLHAEHGHGLVKSSRIVARRYDGRKLRGDASRRLHLSDKTLLRLFYIWKSEGQTAAAFALRYRNARPKITPAKLSAFLRACLLPETASYLAAYRLCGDSSATESGFHRAIPTSVVKPLTALFAQRRRAARIKRKVLAAIVATENGGQSA